MSTQTDIESQVWSRLEEVLDPCSTFTDEPQSIVDLGLVDSVDVRDGVVEVGLLPTNQLCMYIPHMMEDIENRVTSLPGVETVSVETVADKVWTQERMTAEARSKRKRVFQDRVDEHGLSPRYDGENWVEEMDITPEGKTTNHDSIPHDGRDEP